MNSTDESPGLNPLSMLAGVGWVVADLKKFCVSCTFSLTRFFLLDTIDYAMIGATSRQSWLFYLPLARQASLLKDDLLDPVDKLLEDSALVELVRQSLAGRHPPARHAPDAPASPPTVCCAAV